METFNHWSVAVEKSITIVVLFSYTTILIWNEIFPINLVFRIRRLVCLKSNLNHSNTNDGQTLCQRLIMFISQIRFCDVCDYAFSSLFAWIQKAKSMEKAYLLTQMTWNRELIKIIIGFSNKWFMRLEITANFKS